MTDFISKAQTARKEHTCDVCRHKILPGDVYYRHAAPLSPGRHGWISLKSCGKTSYDCIDYWEVDSKVIAKEEIPI